MGWLLLKTMASLGAVLALMLGVAWLLKRYVLGRGAGGSRMIEIDVLGQRMLQPKRSIYVVKVLNKILVVGSGEDGMRTLSEIDDEEVLRQITAAQIHEETHFDGFTRKSEQDGREPKTFSDYLAMNIGAMRSKIGGRKNGTGPFRSRGGR